MANGGALGGWQAAFSESQNVSGGGCSECSSGRMCDCAKICQSKCKKKFKEKMQCAYAVGFAVCLVFVLFVWMMWPMLGATVSAFKNKFATPGASTATSGAYAPNPPPQYMPCRSWIDQGLPLTQTSGYLNGVRNEPGATNGRQMSSKYQMGVDHPGSFDSGATHESQIAVPAAPVAPAAPAAASSPFYSKLDSGFDSKLGSGFDSKLGSGFNSHAGYSKFDGSRLGGFANYTPFSLPQQQPAPNHFIGGTSAQYPSEWATPGRDEDITEMTLRCATQHQYGDVPTQMPSGAAPAAAAASAASAASKPAGFHGFWPFSK